MTNSSYIRGGNSTARTPFLTENTTEIAFIVCIGLVILCGCYNALTSQAKKSRIQPNK
jgi:hypothetical protein